MNFQSLLNKASNNAKQVTKTLEQLESERELQKKNELRRIEVEKKAKMQMSMQKRSQIPKREPTPEKKFVIPKKKTAEPSVDQNRVRNFLAKKEEEKKAAEKQKQIDKEKLIQLRLQNHGGKANKKLGKHFGLNPIDLQIRFGHDHSHVERLQKQQWREEEELDNLKSQYTGGVYKAIQEKNKKLQEAGSSGMKKEPHRVATSKSNSLAGLSSRHAATRDHFSPPKETKKEAPKPIVPLEKKKRPAPPVSFDTLMKVAADKSAGKPVDLSILRPPPSKIPKLNGDSYVSSKDMQGSLNRSSSAVGSSSNNFKKPSSSGLSSSSKIRDPNSNVTRPSLNSSNRTSSSSSASHNIKLPETNSRVKPISTSKSATSEPTDKDKSKKDVKGRFVKGPSPPPAIPQAVLGKRYLPGDVRYKQQQEMLKAAGLPSSSAPIQKKPDLESLFGSSPVRKNHGESSRSIQRPGSSSLSSKSSKVSSGISKEKAMELEKKRRLIEKKRMEKERYERMSLVERERERERQKYMQDHGYDDEEDDDDYDSEMDDFIDDSGMDMDDFSQMDFEETLKVVNPKYNKNMWKHRERMINERDMEANYRTIAAEEARSTRLGFLEDVYEAKKNKSEAL